MKDGYFEQGQGPGSRYDHIKGIIPTTEIIPAWSWTCELCGLENFNRGIIREIEYDLEVEGPDGEIEEDIYIIPEVLCPDVVVCRGCQSKFIPEQELEY